MSKPTACPLNTSPLHMTPFPEATPESMGIRSRDILSLLQAYNQNGPEEETHSLLLLRHGRLVFAGAYAPFSLRDRKTVFSCTKMLTGTAVGFAEAEGLLRGFLLVSLYAAFARRTCTPKQAALFSLLISSGLFAALHLSNPGITPLAMCNLFLAGISFGLFVLRTDDLWGACAMHAAWNFVMGHILGIPVSGLAGTEQVSLLNATFQGSPLLNGESFGLEGGLFVTLVECASIALFLFLPRRPKPMQMEFLG